MYSITTANNFSDKLKRHDIDPICKNVWKCRPKSQEYIFDSLSNINIRTNKSEPFVNNGEDNIIVFSCASNFEFLCTADKIYMDGIFEFCTKYFVQFVYHSWPQKSSLCPISFLSATLQKYNDVFI